MKRNKLYTVNKWNKAAFMPEGNLFLAGGGINANTLNRSLPSLESYLPKGLSEDTYRKLAIGTAGQMQNAFHNYGRSVVDNFGKGNLFNTTSGPTVNSTDAASFFGNNLSVSPNKTSGSTQNTKTGSKGATMQAIGSTALNAASAIDTGDRNGLFDTLDPVYHLAGGRESKVGNALSDTGVSLTKTGNPWLMLAGAGLKIVGGLTNAAFGIKENKENINLVNNNINTANTTGRMFGQATTNSDILDLSGRMATGSGFKWNDLYENGWFTSEGTDKGNALLGRENSAIAYQNNALTTAARDVDAANDDAIMSSFFAYGGPLDLGGDALSLMQQNRYFDTIDKRSEAIAGKSQPMQTGFTGGAKTFAGGGLKAAFLDEFGSDPIGAAVRYNQGLEAMAAQEEARQIEAAKEAEYLGLQQRLSDLETENQGLQAMMAAQQTSMPIVPEIPEETPVSSLTPSKATSNGSTWDYIEDQLRRSGKFNDVQIEGIKYNLQRESSLDPTAVGDGGAAFGLGQWHGKRQPKDRSLEGQTQHLIDTLSAFDGKDHWINKKDYEGFLNARTPEEAHYYIAKGYERPAQRIVDKVKRYSDMSLSKLKAFGGELGTNGTDFTNGLLYIDEGGSHSDNPLGGVPMGLDPEGIPNLVEEGETVYNNYVFSDRMKVPFFMYKELGLGGVMKKKGKEMSFADASKKLAQESEQRPNDPISQDGLQASLSKLAEVQETERMKKQAEEYMGLEYACGGKMNKHACGGKIGHKYEYAGLLNPFQNYGFNYDYQRYAAPRTTPYTVDLNTWQKINSIKEGEKSYSEPKPRTQPRVGTRTGGSDNLFGYMFDSEKAAQEVEKARRKKDADPVIDEATRQKIARDGYTVPTTGEEIAAIEAQRGTSNPIEESYDPYPTWMRYAPVVGAGIMSLTDALGLTNNPDYTYADKIEAAANRAAYAPNIQYKPIGDYMRYSPLDRQYYINQLQANSRATDRALMNSSSPSRAAGLLANGYNTTLSLGNLARQAEEYNRNIYEKTKDFNRKTNMFNSQMDLEAAMANARYRQQAAQFGLSGLAQAAALRDQIDARTGAAKSANLTNFLTSLGNIGRENFALNQINSDRSRQYGVYSNGVSDYKRTAKGKKGSRWT